MKKLLAALFALLLAAPAFAQGVSGAGGGGSSSGGVTAGCGLQGTSTFSLGGITTFTNSGPITIVAGTSLAQSTGSALGGNLTINLPAISAQGTCPIFIDDSAGIIASTGFSFNITPNGADTISGSGSAYAVSTNKGAVRLLPDGSGNWTVEVASVLVPTTCAAGSAVTSIPGSGAVACTVQHQVFSSSCAALATTATTKGCGLVGAAASAATAANVQMPVSQNGNFTAIYVILTADPTSTNTHTFTVVANGSTTGAPSCEVSGVATTCSDTSDSIAISAGQTAYIQDVTTGTPAASSAYIAVTFQPTN